MYNIRFYHENFVGMHLAGDSALLNDSCRYGRMMGRWGQKIYRGQKFQQYFRCRCCVGFKKFDVYTLGQKSCVFLPSNFTELHASYSCTRMSYRIHMLWLA